MLKYFSKFALVSAMVVGLLAMSGGLLGALYFYFRLTRDLPKIQRISDYQPLATTSVLADDGQLIAEIYEERRYPVSFEEVPEMVRNAFLAAEDANFYQHPGIDFVSIIRALWVNLRSKSSRQGASTITQQIVKSLLLSREKTYERKAKEAILSYRLERALSKDDILTIYLNEIFLGSGAYGVKAAAKVHFHKELDELSLAEAAYLAGLPQRPSELTDPRNREKALERQRYVLHQMLRNGMVTRDDYRAAREEELTIYPPDYQTVFAAPYFAGEVIKRSREIFDSFRDGRTPGSPGGFVIKTTVNVEAYKLAERALQRALRELDKRQGFRGPLDEKRLTDYRENYAGRVIRAAEELQADEIYPAVIERIDAASGIAEVKIDDVRGIVNLAEAQWARHYIRPDDSIRTIKPQTLLKVGDVIEVALDPEPPQKRREGMVYLDLEQVPAVQGAFAVQNALTGEVKAVIGGYDYRRSIFNRATQGLLQPGSAFKPFIYLTALEELSYTPSTIVPDSPISMPAGDGTIWSPQNYDHKYLGPITLRTALQRSRNVVSVYLLQRVGIDRGISVAKRLGITTPIPRNMSIALGTPEVKLIEMVNAYGAFAAEGYLADQIFIRSITDRQGNVVYEKLTEQKKVIEDTEAFLMANMMKGVVERGTAQLIKKLERPVAGKTGTTNEQMDAWFIGYTPEWVAGTWVGFDHKRTLGRFETGGKAAAPAFLYFMQEFLKDEPELDFNIPDGAIPVAVNLSTGQLADPSSPGAFIEYFKSGTEPTRTAREIELPRDYLTSDEF